MRKSWTAGFVLLAAIAAAFPVHPAAADGTVLTVVDVGGPAVAVGDALTTTAPDGAVFTTAAGGTTGVGCGTADLTATISTNPAAPGTATGALRVLSFTDCGSNIRGCGSPVLTFQSLPYAVSIGSNGTVTITARPDEPLRLIAGCRTPLGPVTCVYQPGAAGYTATLANTDKSLVFTNVQFTKNSGPAVCPTQLFLTATYAQLQDANQTVFLN